MTEELKKTPNIDRYTDDLTVAAAKNPDEYKAVARNQEIKQVIINLNRKTKNNPILIGEAGVGKTAIIEGLARLIALHKAGKQLEGKHIRVLQIAALGQQDTVMKMLNIINEWQIVKFKLNILVDRKTHKGL